MSSATATITPPEVNPATALVTPPRNRRGVPSAPRKSATNLAHVPITGATNLAHAFAIASDPITPVKGPKGAKAPGAPRKGATNPAHAPITGATNLAGAFASAKGATDSIPDDRRITRKSAKPIPSPLLPRIVIPRTFLDIIKQMGIDISYQDIGQIIQAFYNADTDREKLLYEAAKTCIVNVGYIPESFTLNDLFNEMNIRHCVNELTAMKIAELIKHFLPHRQYDMTQINVPSIDAGGNPVIKQLNVKIYYDSEFYAVQSLILAFFNRIDLIALNI